ncbi:acylphosphatase [Virgibacillus soli]|uniref:Acylphosphatase n=1 Tax=Paracerasibacillus soli TaxID=480284 RepID=A0ABU5CPI2_9BACI|nr:acylphosphatase [Virgibacillus soli]MDY0408261.1 acylphosphatase [Virgibacillus soli]
MYTRILVFGHVQGVGFRITTKLRADQLELAGFVRNLPDGSVEIKVEGNKHKIAALIEEIKSGYHPGIVIERLDIEKGINTNSFKNFIIK